jgi:5-methylcytosine-specific restriction endonuclease McrA
VIEEPTRLQMQILPSDDIDVPGGLDLLVASGLLERGELLDTRRFLQIVNFPRHQKVSNPTPSKIAREKYRKVSIPNDVRRKVAVKYGCKPGGSIDVQCYSCGAPGRIWWPNTSAGKPGFWVSFSALELSHFEPEAKNGATTCDNIVLCCQTCNRSMGTNDPVSVMLAKTLETSREFCLEGEGKGRELKGNGEGCNEVAKRPSLPPSSISADKLVYPTFGCTRGRRSGPDTWLLTTDYIAELQQTFEAVDVAAECRAAWQWHKTNWAKRKTAEGMPDFLRRWIVRAQNSGRGKPAPATPQSRLPDLEDERKNWVP